MTVTHACNSKTALKLSRVGKVESWKVELVAQVREQVRPVHLRSAYASVCALQGIHSLMVRLNLMLPHTVLVDPDHGRRCK